MSGRPLAFAGILLTVACQEPEVTWQGEAVSFAADDPDAVCGGTLEWMDARAVAMQEVFGAGRTRDIEFSWLPETWSKHSPCKANPGCAQDDHVYAVDIPHEHEMVHAIRYEGLPRVFEEGLATMFGDLGFQWSPVPREQLVDIFERNDPESAQEYSRVAHFVAFLVERHGLETLLRLGDHAGYYAPRWKVESAFEDVYGYSLDQALADYEEFPECDPPAWADTRIACAEADLAFEVPFVGKSEFIMNLDCNESDVLGPHYGMAFSEIVLDLDFPLEYSAVHFQLVGDVTPGSAAMLAGCGGCGDAVTIAVNHDDSHEFEKIPDGRYVLRLFRPVDEPGELGIRFQY